MSGLLTLMVVGAASSAVAVGVVRLDDWRRAKAEGRQFSRYLDNSRWSPEDATRAEGRLHRRLGRGKIGAVAADPEAYARWRSDLIMAARERLFEDFNLRLKGRVREGSVRWRDLSSGERRLIRPGLGQHLFQLILRKPAQQFPEQCAVRNGLGHVDGCDVAPVDHPDLSCVLQPGEDAESGAGQSLPPATPLEASA